MKLLIAFSTLLPSVFALWPLPTHLSNGTTPLTLGKSFDIKISIHNPPADLVAAVSRTKGYLENDKLQALVVDRGASSASAIAKAKSLPSLTLSLTSTGSVKSISEEAVAALEDRVEGYTLTVPSDGSGAVIKANSTLGLYRGLTTFGQLWYDWNGATYTLSAPIQISDSPAYPYRGFMLDTARNYFAVADIKRTLDAMSWVKINALHWHVVDSQSFPLEIPGYTALSEKGAYSGPSGSPSVYTKSDVADIVSYAAARGIDVIPEIDTPGHTAVIANAFPEHIACNQAAPWASFANEPPAGQLRLASEATVNFTAGLLKAAAGLFQSQYFSTGGDEINANCYTQDNETQASLAASNQTFAQALNTFTLANHAALRSVGKSAIVWEEMVLADPVTLANDTIVMVWISSDDVLAVAETGFRIVHAASNYFYLDCGHGGWVGDFPAGNSWCDPFKTWQNTTGVEAAPMNHQCSDTESGVSGCTYEFLWTSWALNSSSLSGRMSRNGTRMSSCPSTPTLCVPPPLSVLWLATHIDPPTQAYTFDPSANLTAAQSELVLGGQSLLWTEQSSGENLDSTTWPRAASTAELFWSGPGGNVDTALPRLHEVVYRFRQRGVAANALQPEWCALRPGACDLLA
ncbi:N-acetylhexosaminidase [Mycena galopus ATCC 62051]|nr:N-acetylhexosaminidase [Mycena galopus ATCC 62051]